MPFFLQEYIKSEMEKHATDYTEKVPLRVFCITYNLNGKKVWLPPYIFLLVLDSSLTKQ